MAAGRAGAAARKAKQEERLLEQLRAAKGSFRPTAAPANIPPKEADQAVSRPERREGLTNWTLWIVGACLTDGALVFLRQTRSPASVAAGPVYSATKQRVDKPPRPDRQLKPGPDPFYMEWATMTTPATDGKMIVNALYTQRRSLRLGHGIRPARQDGDGE